MKPKHTYIDYETRRYNIKLSDTERTALEQGQNMDDFTFTLEKLTVLDNASIHKSAKIKERMEEEMTLHFLSASVFPTSESG